MNADLEDLSPDLRADMLKDKEYLKTQSIAKIQFYKDYGSDAQWDENKPIFTRPAGK